jgi:hypothetical protein
MIKSIAHDQPQKNFKYLWLDFPLCLCVLDIARDMLCARYSDFFGCGFAALGFLRFIFPFGCGPAALCYKRIQTPRPEDYY